MDKTSSKRGRPKKSSTTGTPGGRLKTETIRPESLASAGFLPPSTIALKFADGLSASLSIESLDLPVDKVVWQTLAASPEGLKITADGTKGERISIDAATLRYLVDVEYAARIDKSIGDMHIAPAEQKEASRLSELTRDPRWLEVGHEDDLIE